MYVVTIWKNKHFFILLVQKPFDFRFFWDKMDNKWEIVVKSGNKWV